MTTPAVREKLRELEGIFNLEREEDHPHVYWSVPRDWFPGGILFTRDQMPDLLRLLMRLPPGKARDGLLETVVRTLPKGEALLHEGGLPTAVVPPSATKQEEQ